MDVDENLWTEDGRVQPDVLEEVKRRLPARLREDHREGDERGLMDELPTAFLEHWTHGNYLVAPSAGDYAGIDLKLFGTSIVVLTAEVLFPFETLLHRAPLREASA